jgi:hypothetical protein
MAGTLKTNAVQLGDSATATQNLTIRTNADGTFTIARGNVGATTQDVLTIDANGVIAMPQTIVAFSAYSTTAQLLPTSTSTKLLFPTEEVDTNNSFASSRFQPTVAGWYWVCGGFQVATSLTTLILQLQKTGVVYKNIGYVANTGGCFGGCMVYLNGSTDYVELFASQTAAAQNTDPSSSGVYFQGHLVAKA